jgi:sulfur transfer complex TusBCD TusB component (DsrH family)
METKNICETLVSNSTSTWLIALEDFSARNRRENFTSYVIKIVTVNTTLD